jgi:hypothetical protein
MKYKVTVLNGDTHESSSQTITMEDTYYPEIEAEAEAVLKMFFTNVDLDPDYFDIRVSSLNYVQSNLYLVGEFVVRQEPVHNEHFTAVITIS